MEDAINEGRGGVEEAEMRFELEKVAFGGLDGGPEDGIVIGKKGEENAEKEGRRCGRLGRWVKGGSWWGGERDSRQTIRKVANEKDGIVDVDRLTEKNRRRVVRFKESTQIILYFVRCSWKPMQ